MAHDGLWWLIPQNWQFSTFPGPRKWTTPRRKKIRAITAFLGTSWGPKWKIATTFSPIILPHTMGPTKELSITVWTAGCSFGPALDRRSSFAHMSAWGKCHEDLWVHVLQWPLGRCSPKGLHYLLARLNEAPHTWWMEGPITNFSLNLQGTQIMAVKYHWCSISSHFTTKIDKFYHVRWIFEENRQFGPIDETGKKSGQTDPYMGEIGPNP